MYYLIYCNVPRYIFIFLMLAGGCEAKSMHTDKRLYIYAYYNIRYFIYIYVKSLIPIPKVSKIVYHVMLAHLILSISDGVSLLLVLIFSSSESSVPNRLILFS